MRNLLPSFYRHVTLTGLETVIKDEYCKILWDFPRNTNKEIQHDRSDVMVIYKENGNVLSLTLCFHEPKKMKAR